MVDSSTNSSCLKILELSNPPFFGYDNNPPHDPYGVDIKMFDLLMKHLNHCYEIVNPKDMMWGEVLPNGTMTGMVEMINKSRKIFLWMSRNATKNRLHPFGEQDRSTWYSLQAGHSTSRTRLQTKMTICLGKVNGEIIFTEKNNSRS
ncbi:hypothetical protein SK128_011603 [Halocaridina rubra]|uniref:Uncharacterized protein n=1 Tax=Halocaridina rubra TaxID=373956 RepID=A0AAN8WKU4_HALRR